MLKRILCALGCLMALNSVYSQTPETGKQVFVHFVEPVGLVLIEPVQPGMTLYSMSRKYNVGIDSILAVNPELDPRSIPLGYPVNIPLSGRAFSFTPPADPIMAIPMSYRVQPKETVYRISTVYLGTHPDSIFGLNPMSRERIAIGQVLNIGWYVPGANTENPVSSGQVSMDSTQYAVKDYTSEYLVQGRKISEQKGLAIWKPGNINSHYFVLHATAKVGSYMEVTNPMLRRTVTAKVAGNIPEGLYPNTVGLVVSHSMARALGVLDQQFFAKWRYIE